MIGQACAVTNGNPELTSRIRNQSPSTSHWIKSHVRTYSAAKCESLPTDTLLLIMKNITRAQDVC